MRKIEIPNDTIVVTKGYSRQIIDTNITDWLQQKETNMGKIEIPNDTMVVTNGYSWQIIDTNITDWL